MSTPLDMYQSEARDEWGNPLGACPTRPIASISDVRAPVTSTVNQNTDYSSNKPLPYVVGIAVLASLALMGVLMMPMVIDAKVRAGSAKCEAISELARNDAAVAKDTVDQWAAKQKAGVK